jgi:hypothetical protein
MAVTLPPGSGCAASTSAACKALRDTYASPPFDHLDAQPGGQSIFDRILGAIGDGLSWLFTHLGAGAGSLLFILILAAMVGFVVYRLRGRGGVAVGATAAETAPAPVTDDPEAEWRAAESAAHRREYREAIRRAFRSALLEVMRRGRLPVDSTWTTRELLGAAAGDADLMAALAPAATSFDVAWYSGHDVTEQDWNAARTRCETVRALARGARAEATAATP